MACPPRRKPPTFRLLNGENPIMPHFHEGQAVEDLLTYQDDRRKQMKKLFARYPEITSTEREELVRYLRTAPVLDIGLLKSDETIRYRIAAFEQEHARKLSLRPVEIAVLLLIFALVTGACVALWDIGV